MYGITIVDRASPYLERISKLMRGPLIAQRYVGAVAKLIRKNFAALDDERANSMGGKRTNFYAVAALATKWNAEADGGTISVHAEGIAQRLFGGTIEPVKAKYLAIPARSESYGHSPRDFQDLEPHFGDHGGALVQRVQGMKNVADRRKGHKKGDRRDVDDHKREQGLVFFWLVKSVTQDPDDTVLPDSDDMYVAGRLAVDDLIRKTLKEPNLTLPPEDT